MMNSIGEFHEGEIDGKPFHIFSFLSHTDTQTSSSSVDSGGDDLSLQPLFLCPSSRRRVYWESNDYFQGRPYNISPHFPNIRSADQQVHQFLTSDSDGFCKLPVVPLFWCNNKQLDSRKLIREFRCGGCQQSEIGTDYYICLTCQQMYHKECVESPVEIKHPSYPLLSFQLHDICYRKSCICCELEIGYMHYHCPTYNLYMHTVCAMKPIPFFIDHPKRHPHPLTFFPKQTYLPCDVCGLIKESSPTYVCARCLFVVHRDCIYFPYVIKISRHHHRISFTYSLPSGQWSCGVCRRKVVNHCGAYFCNKCNDYFVHTRCALRKDVWDGKDLEGVPEEPEIIVEPFETIADGIILHFSHGHHLKLEESRVYDEYNICQACILPIYEGNYYSCMERCDFLLHETCASAPCKKHHALHALPLTLKAVIDGDVFRCDACQRLSCGFVYEAGYYKIDVRCASVSEPFEYQGHGHPLFLALDPEQEREATCQICQEKSIDVRKLNCIECNFVICFRCATLPYKAKYKHDKHFLTFREGKERSDQFDWCEVCEKKVVYSENDGFYACDDCCTTLHVRCLLGEEDLYMQKPGLTVMLDSEEAKIHVLPNNTMSRPFCHQHDEDRCPHKVVYKWRGFTFCSSICVMNRNITRDDLSSS